MLKYAVVPVAAVAGLAIAASGSATRTIKTSSSSSSPSPVAAFDLLPESEFPGIVRRGQPSERGTLTFRFSFMGHATIITTATSVSAGQVGTLSRSSSDFVLRFTRLHYSVAPVTLPNGLVVASQAITLNPRAQNTLRIDRRTGAVTADLRWVVDAPNTLYNGSHIIEFADRGERRFLSFKQIGPGRYSFNIRSEWHGSVALTHWSVAGQALPGGDVTLEGIWNGYYDLDVKHAGRGAS